MRDRTLQMQRQGACQLLSYQAISHATPYIYLIYTVYLIYYDVFCALGVDMSFADATYVE